MDTHILTTLLPYLHSDADRVHLMQTCKAFAAYIPLTTYTDEYDYDYICDIPFRQNFTDVYYSFTLSLNGLNRDYGYYIDYNIRPIPECVTHLYYDSDVPIDSVLTHNRIKQIDFGPYFNSPIIGLIPKSVKKIRVSQYFTHPVPDWCEVKVYHYGP